MVKAHDLGCLVARLAAPGPSRAVKRVRAFLDCGIIFVTAPDAGLLLNRHPNQVRRWCSPIACDIASRVLLYDVDDVNRALKPLARQPWANGRTVA